MVADMAMNVEAARLLVYKSAWLVDRGENNVKAAAFAKAFAADVAMKTTTGAVQVFGGWLQRRVPGRKADATPRSTGSTRARHRSSAGSSAAKLFR